MFDEKLWHIKDELNSKGSNSQLSLYYVMKRLNKSLESYMYDIEYTVNGITKRGKYSLGIISNANRIAGINNFYKDVKLDDNVFEVLFCSIKKRSALLRSLFRLGITDITKVNGVELYRTNKIKIKFFNKLKKSWTIDGEKYQNKDTCYEITVNKDIKFRISNTAIKDNCIK